MDVPMLPVDVSIYAIEHGVRLGESAIRWHSDRGTLPCMRTPTGVRVFAKKDVEDFIAAQLRKTLASHAHSSE